MAAVATLKDHGSDVPEVDSNPLDFDDLYDMKKELNPVASKWKSIGIGLRLTPNILEDIQTLNSGDNCACLSSTLTEWLKRNYNVERFGEPTWQWLVDVVGDPAGGANKGLARSITRRHKHRVPPMPISTGVQQTTSNPQEVTETQMSLPPLASTISYKPSPFPLTMQPDLVQGVNSSPSQQACSGRSTSPMPPSTMESPEAKGESVGIIEHKDYVKSIKNSLKFIVSGKMGVGKSALINGLSGKMVAKEGTSPIRVTNEITGYELTIEATDKSISKGVEVVVYDTPGLADPLHDEEANLTEISKHCLDADLLIYCLDMRRCMTPDDTLGMKELTQHLGPDVWKNAIFVLTFANEAAPSKPRPTGWLEKLTFGHLGSSVDREREANFRLLLEAKEKEIPRLFRDNLKLPEELSRHVCIVPAGYHTIPPPDRTDWLSEFWLTALGKIQQHSMPLLKLISSSSIQSHCKW